MLKHPRVDRSATPSWRRFPVALVAALALLAAARPSAAVAAGGAVDFNREVRPILSQNCFKCHGIDDKGRKGKLRLDVREGALAAGKSGDAAVVPGKADGSELIRRVFAHDPDEVMPPASTKVKLSDAQKDVLRRWVNEGANYQPHWAFEAPVQAPLPAVQKKDWPRNAIDAFVLARLEKEGLSPSAEADRYTLVRRLSLDLIGLPPTPAEADAFVNDSSPDAYEKLVDRLLASPHYGERWARRWLDLARYADTNGYEKDRPRTIWPYRDWVINALNADVPFDQFTIEQLAGDMLPNATEAQRVATGFHRNTMLNEEVGIDPLEFRYHATVDRIGTTGTTWLGLTVACAQCHDHKFDPITHKEYFSLLAFLNNADEPQLELAGSGSAADEAKRRREAEQRVEVLTAALPSKWPVGDAKWTVAAGATITAASGATFKAVGDGAYRIAGKPADAPDRDSYTIVIDSDAASVDRVRLEVLKAGKGGPGRTEHGNFVLTDVTATVAPKDAPQDARPVKFARAEADFSQPDYDVAGAIDGKPASGWAIHEGGKPATSRTATFYLDKPVDLPKGARWTIKLDQAYGRRHTILKLRLSLGAPAATVGQPVEVARKASFDAALAAWEARESKRAMKWTVVRPAATRSSTPILTPLDDGSILASGDISKSDTYDLTFRPADLAGATAIRIEALPHESLPKRGPGLVYYEGPAGDFCLSEISLTAGEAKPNFAKAAHSFAAGHFTAAMAIDGNPQTGWMIDGGQGRPHVAVFALDKPLAAGAAADVTLRMLFERHFAPALGRFRVSVTTDGRAADPAALPVEVAGALAVPAGERTAAQKDAILRGFVEAAPELASARQEIEKVRRAAPQPVTTLVLSERPAGHGRKTHLHNRGEFLQPTEPVEPGVPSFLPPLPADQPRNRLTLARWLVSGEHPLTGRVAVNRQWAAFFGRGLVRTTEDFGFQGDLPTHPELLDWLAIEFVKRQGWSMKKLHRLIVTSATYRQSSRTATDLAARDPQNLLLARGPRFRADAEVVRDASLAAAGLLTAKLGGPSVFPPQPASVTTEGTYGAFQWNASTGEDRFRRSLYTFAKRTAPFAMYGTFDAPTGEACVARRDLSNTPLQALTLLNDTVFVEAAQSLGKLLGESAEPDEARVAALFRRFLVRPPEAEELSQVVAFVRAQRERFGKKELDAAKVAGSAEGNVVERATWTAAARVVMNLDEAVTKG